jgi:AcrR family transcriptional regulator
MKTALTPRKSPRQARSQATVDAILDATARVLVDRGYAAANTNLVAELAGVSVGSLYQYFPNKDSLVRALHDRHARRMNHVIDLAFAKCESQTLAQAFAGVIEALVDAHRVEAGLHRVLETQLAGLGDLDGRAEAEAAISARVLELLAQYRHEIHVPDLKMATFVLEHSLHALVHALVDERPDGVSVEQATQEVIRLGLAYLTAPR